MRKSLTAVTVLSVLSVFSGVTAAPITASARPDCKFVFLTPHQDDELLSQGPAIQNHIKLNGAASVCVSLMTTGESSGVRSSLSTYGFIPRGTSKVVKATLDPGQLTRARDKEAWNALVHLGVPQDNIFIGKNAYGGPYAQQMGTWTRVKDMGWRSTDGTHVSTYYPGGGATSWNQAQANAFVAEAIAFFGSASHYKTQSPYDASGGDHAALGLALKNNTSPVASKRYYMPTYALASTPKPNGASPSTIAEQSPDWPTLDKAAHSYGMWNPGSGFYHLGWQSVRDLFGGPDALATKLYDSDNRTYVAGTESATSLYVNRKSNVHQ